MRTTRRVSRYWRAGVGLAAMAAPVVSGCGSDDPTETGGAGASAAAPTTEAIVPVTGDSAPATSATTSAPEPAEEPADEPAAEPVTDQGPVGELVVADVDYGAQAAVGYEQAPLLDVWALDGVDHAPVVIVVDGLMPDRDDMEPLATELAGRGYVVLNTEWQLDPEFSIATGANYHGACAVRFARANAARYGGDPDDIAVLGWSAGGAMASVLALNGNGIAGQCTNDEALSAVPDRFIALAGGFEYLELDTVERNGIGPAVWEEDPALWEVMNPYEHLDQATGTSALLIHGTADQAATVGSTERFAAALEANDGEATIHVLEGVDHFLVGGPQLATVVDLVDTWLAGESP